MLSVNMAVLGGAGAHEIAGQVGKKGGETDVTQYNAKQGERSLTMFVPNKYPDKIQGVSYALQSAEYVVIVIDALDKTVGEQIVAADLIGADRGFFLLRNYIQPDQVKPLLAGTSLAQFEFLESADAHRLRERFFDLPVRPRPGDTRVDIDQHFNVKGVGTVALGIVTRGEVKKHQDLRVFPTKHNCQVRSIQVHDDDHDVAGAGSRVGLALKGIENDLLDRGHVLAPDRSLQVVGAGDMMRLSARVPKFYKKGLVDGQVVHVGIGMQFTPAKLRIEGGGLGPGERATLSLVVEKPVVATAGDRALLFDLDSQGLRVAAGGTVP